MWKIFKEARSFVCFTQFIQTIKFQNSISKSKFVKKNNTQTYKYKPKFTFDRFRNIRILH